MCRVNNGCERGLIFSQSTFPKTGLFGSYPGQMIKLALIIIVRSAFNERARGNI
jgi:hypothetical protein